MAKSIDERIFELGMLHDGAVSGARLSALGVSASSVRSRVRSGTLRRVAKGIYIVSILERDTSMLAAAQLGLPTAVVSHRSAARLHGMRVYAPGPEVSATPGVHHAFPGVRVHQTVHLPADDVMTLDRIELTTPARTIWDLVTQLGPTLHRDVTQSQLATGRPTKDDLLACHRSMARQGRNGTKKMRELLLMILDDEPFPESELELLVHSRLVDLGAPPLLRQFRPPWYNGVSGIVDFADPIGMTIIEADGRRWHAAESARRRDLARDLEAGTYGYFVYRVGWHEVVHRTDTTMSDVARLLRSRHETALRAR